MKRINRAGVSLVETLLAAAVLVLIVTGLVGALIYGRESTFTAGLRARAVLLADEGMEATRNIRDGNFANLTIGTHGISAGATWTFLGTSDLTELFSRQITVATASGSDDRRDVTASATWQQTPSRSGLVKIYTRFTNWQRKFGNWASPSQQSSLNLAGNQAGNKVAVSGNFAFVVRNGGTPNFAVIDVTNPASPSLTGSLNLPGIPTNIFVLGSYAYVTSTNNTGELQIVNVANPASPIQVGTDNPTGNGDAMGVWVIGTTAYVTRAGNTNNFAIINVSNPSSPTQTSILSLAGPLYEVTVMGNFAYISSGDNASELQVVNVSNPSSPSLVGSLNLAGNADAVTIAGFQSPNTVFLGQNDGTMSVVNVTNPLSPSFISSFAAGTSTNDLSFGLGNGYLLLATAHSTQEFQVLDISTLTTPTLLGTLNLGNALNGVVYDQVRDRAYVVGTNNSAEFIVLKPL